MSTKCRAALVLLAVVGGACIQPSFGIASLSSTRVASGLNRPIFVTAPPGDPRLFIIEQRGVIRILSGGSVLPTPFFDIDSLIPDISGNDERGLLGLAFHPDFPDSPFFYVDYFSNASQTVIARYQVSGADSNRADHSSAQIRLTINQPFTNHNGGTLAFGPDRYLYIGMGDGGSGGDPGNRAQTLSELLGKMLRIDVMHGYPYSIPPDNPFFNDPDPGIRQEIWDYGFRNPYRWSFDRLTGDLWIADVGQNLYEEIDFEPDTCRGGKNYGWRLMEGDSCYNPPSGCDTLTGLVRPIHVYDHNTGCSVTGGAVYRGSAISGLQGAYFFADYCSDSIWSLRYDGTKTDFRDRTAELGSGVGDIAAIGQDGFGELYLVDRGVSTSTSAGEIYKIVGTETGVEPGARPIGFTLTDARPNPFSSSTRVDATLTRGGKLVVEVVAPSGRLLRRLASGTRPPGSYPFEWDGRDQAGRAARSGTYWIRVTLDGQVIARQVSLVR